MDGRNATGVLLIMGAAAVLVWLLNRGTLQRPTVSFGVDPGEDVMVVGADAQQTDPQDGDSGEIGEIFQGFAELNKIFAESVLAANPTVQDAIDAGFNCTSRPDGTTVCLGDAPPA